MADVRPFRALRPVPEHAAAVIAPPYDVLDDAEARAIAGGDPRSFLHVTRPEVGLPLGTLPAQRVVWEKGRDNLRRMAAEGLLQREDQPAYYVYGQVADGHRQTGFLAACQVAEYDGGTIKRHEHTLPEKEDDRTRHLETLDAQVGLVFLAYRAHEGLAALARRITARDPLWRVTTDDGVLHTLWVAPPQYTEAIRQGFREVPALYVADGHHRTAAASRIHAARGDGPSASFVAGLFPDDALHVLGYHRVVRDLAGHTPASFLDAVREAGFEVVTGTPTPPDRGHVAMGLDGTWYVLTPPAHVLTADDPVDRLDTAWLQKHLLAPLLDIGDPRHEPRLSFLGGHKPPEALMDAAVRHGGVAFRLHPTGMDQLFDVADAGEVMPPKSTWFEPKLREGVVVRMLDEADV